MQNFSPKKEWQYETAVTSGVEDEIDQSCHIVKKFTRQKVGLTSKEFKVENDHFSTLSRSPPCCLSPKHEELISGGLSSLQISSQTLSG